MNSNKKRGLVFFFTIIITLLLSIFSATALEISNVEFSQITSSSAQISWRTDQPSKSFIYYAVSKEALQNNPQTLVDSTLISNHRFALAGLVAKQQYFFYLKSIDSSSNEIIADDNGNYYTFTTLEPDTTPPDLDVELPESIRGNKADFSGTSEPGATINLYIKGTLASTTFADAQGKFEFTSIILPENSKSSVKVEAVDAAGNAVSFEQEVLTDSIRPKLELEELPALSEKSDIKIAGKVSEASEVKIFMIKDQDSAGSNSAESGRAVFDKKLGANEKFSADIRLAEGKSKIKITATDAVGWESEVEFTIESDTQAPRVKFEMSKGTQYYEGRAETDISGETEPGAKVYLYVFNPRSDQYRADFKRAIASTTADDKGKFTFAEISFPPPVFTSLEDLAPRIVPTGLEGILISPLSELGSAQAKTYHLYIIAEDKTGKTGFQQKTITVNTCYSADFAFDISQSLEFPPQPSKLDPQYLEDGRQTISALFNISYRGSATPRMDSQTHQVELPYRINSIRAQKACTRDDAESDDYNLGCKLLPAKIDGQANFDKSLYYLTSTLLPAADFVKREDNIWDDFVKRQLKMPIKMIISYNELETNQNGQTSLGPAKTQVACLDLGYFVDIPIKSSEMIPDFLVEEGLPALNKTISAIETVQKPLHTASIAAGVLCSTSFTSKLVFKYYRKFISVYEPWLTRNNNADKDGKNGPCPYGANQDKMILESTQKAMQKAGIQNYDKKSILDDQCPKTASAWGMETFFDSAFRWTCDRFLCRSVPAHWTEDKTNEKIQTTILEEQQCSATANCVPLKPVEDCKAQFEKVTLMPPFVQPILADQAKPLNCFQDRYGIIFAVDNTYPVTKSADGKEIKKLVAVKNPISLNQFPRTVIMAHSEKGQLCESRQESCVQVCTSKPGFKPVNDGYQGQKNTNALAGQSSTVNTYPIGEFEINVKKEKKTLLVDVSENIYDAATQTKITINDPYLNPIKNSPNYKNALDIAKRAAARTPITIQTTGQFCYKEDPADKNKLKSKSGNELSGTQYSAGYTSDCFISNVDPDNPNHLDRLQCVCEQTADPKKNPKGTDDLIIASEKTSSMKEAWPWIYREAKLYEESGIIGTYYSPDRYYEGRDFSAAFGLDHVLDWSKTGGEKISKINPRKQYAAPYQTACFPAINAQLEMLKSILIGFQGCLTEAKYTGLHDAGLCKTFFTQNVCGLLYKGISYLNSQCSPLSMKDQISGIDGSGIQHSEKGVKAFFNAGFSAITDSMDESVRELRTQYGDANVEHYFAMGKQSFAESMCLFAFGYDFPMGMDFIQDVATSFSTKVDTNFIIANRHLSSFNPAKGTAIYDYELGGYMLAGCGVRSYRTELKCVGPEDLGRPGVDASCYGNGCDCLNSNSRPEFQSEKTYLVQSGTKTGNVPKGQYYELPIESPLPVSSNFRYDHVVVDVFLEQGENADHCFDDGYKTSSSSGRFYFPIRDQGSELGLQCNVDVTSGKFICPNVRSLFTGGKTYLEHPYLQCYDKNTGLYANCDTPNLFVMNDPIIVRPYMFVGNEPVCLKISDRRNQVSVINQLLGEGVTGSISPPLNLGPVNNNMFSSIGSSTIIKMTTSSAGCGGQGVGQLEIKTTPSRTTASAKDLKFAFTHNTATNEYELTVDSQVQLSSDSVNAGYKILAGYKLAKTISGVDPTSLSDVDVNNAIFTVDGFEFSKVLGSPTDSSGQCVYRTSPNSANFESGNIGGIDLNIELLQPRPGGDCTTASVRMPSTNLGKTFITQRIQIQKDLIQNAAATTLYQDFKSGNYVLLRSRASQIVQLNQNTLADAQALYYWIASIKKEKGTTAPAVAKAEINQLLTIFFENREYDYSVTSKGEYGRIEAYLCKFDKWSGGNHHSGTKCQGKT